MQLHLPYLLLTALLAGAAALGCGASDPRACSVTCGVEGDCPNGTECGPDRICYAPDEEPGSCAVDPADAGGGGDGPAPDSGGARSDASALGFAGESSPALVVPDDTPLGIETVIAADVRGLEVDTVQVHLEIDHTWRGDMVLTLISPAGESAPVVELLPEDSGLDVRGVFDVAGFTPGSPGDGDWTLLLVDRGPGDIGILEFWSIGINRPAP